MDELSWQEPISFYEMEASDVSPIDKYVYRYEGNDYYGMPSLVLRKYPVLRETPKGCWIKYLWQDKWCDPKSGGFAQETKLAALKRFIRRKKTYRQILGTKYDNTSQLIKMAEKELEKMK